MAIHAVPLRGAFRFGGLSVAKLSILALVFLFVGVLASCGENTDDEDAIRPTPTKV